jgi:hypothetical protein
MRLNDVVLHEKLKFLTTHPTDQYHAIILEDLTIWLDIFNIASFFHGRTPTKREYYECERIELTYPSPEWSPNSDLYAEEESKCVDKEGYAHKFRGARCSSSIIHDDGEFIRCINTLAILQTGEVRETISGVKSDKFKMNSDFLCNNWGIGNGIAGNTIKATTHLRAQTINHPNIERQ